jgi:hypothetical protein
MLFHASPSQNFMTWAVESYFMVPSEAVGVVHPAPPLPAVPATCQVVPSQNRGTWVAALYPRSPFTPAGLVQAAKAFGEKKTAISINSKLIVAFLI